MTGHQLRRLDHQHLCIVCFKKAAALYIIEFELADQIHGSEAV